MWGWRRKDGKLLWKVSLGFGGAAIIPTPLFHKGYVFATSGYGGGCGLVELKADGSGGIQATKVYANKNMENKHGGVVLVDGYLYGYSESNGWICSGLFEG